MDIIKLLCAGAGRGAREMLPYLRELNQRAVSFQVHPTYIDPQPGRATELKDQALATGLTAEAVEDRIEHLLGTGGIDPLTPVVLHLDQPQAVAKVLAIGHPRIMFFQLVRTPREALLGIAGAFAPDDQSHQAQAQKFLGALGKLAVRSGSNRIVGERGRFEHRLQEPLYRRTFAQLLSQNLGKLVSGQEAETSPLLVSWDGVETEPLLVTGDGSAWSEPLALAGAVAANPAVPLIRGDQFSVVELGPDGVRFHRVRLRKLDGKLSLRGAAVLDQASIAQAEAAERAARAAEAALQRAQRQTITSTQPVWTTD